MGKVRKSFQKAILVLELCSFALIRSNEMRCLKCYAVIRVWKSVITWFILLFAVLLFDKIGCKDDKCLKLILFEQEFYLFFIYRAGSPDVIIHLINYNLVGIDPIIVEFLFAKNYLNQTAILTGKMLRSKAVDFLNDTNRQ